MSAAAKLTLAIFDPIGFALRGRTLLPLYTCTPRSNPTDFPRLVSKELKP